MEQYLYRKIISISFDINYVGEHRILVKHDFKMGQGKHVTPHGARYRSQDEWCVLFCLNCVGPFKLKHF